MKHFLHQINVWLKTIFDKDIATKDRTVQFRIVVAMLLCLVIFLITYSVTKSLTL